MNSVWVSFGIFLTYVLNYFDLHWRTIAVIYAAMSFLCMFAVYAIPESPQWFVAFRRRRNEDEHFEKMCMQSVNWFYNDKKVSITSF